MRKIKFRAWITPENKRYNNGGQMWNWEKVQNELHSDGKFWHMFWEPEYRDAVVPMQYTGMVDSKGVEIYEGDIVEYEFGYENKIREAVVFEGRNFCLTSGNNYMPEENNRTVVGNVWENPDLLAKKDI